MSTCPTCQNTKTPKHQNAKMPKCQNTKIPKYQNLKMPKCQHIKCQKAEIQSSFPQLYVINYGSAVEPQQTEWKLMMLPFVTQVQA